MCSFCSAESSFLLGPSRSMLATELAGVRAVVTSDRMTDFRSSERSLIEVVHTRKVFQRSMLESVRLAELMTWCFSCNSCSGSVARARHFVQRPHHLTSQSK